MQLILPIINRSFIYSLFCNIGHKFTINTNGFVINNADKLSYLNWTEIAFIRRGAQAVPQDRRVLREAQTRFMKQRGKRAAPIGEQVAQIAGGGVMASRCYNFIKTINNIIVDIRVLIKPVPIHTIIKADVFYD